MSIFTISHAEKKQVCLDALDDQNLSNDDVYAVIMACAHSWPVDHGQLGALVMSQLGVDHRAGARKGIERAIPDRSPRLWLRVALWPLAVVLRVVGAVLRLGKI